MNPCQLCYARAGRPSPQQQPRTTGALGRAAAEEPHAEAGLHRAPSLSAPMWVRALGTRHQAPPGAADTRPGGGPTGGARLLCAALEARLVSALGALPMLHPHSRGRVAWEVLVLCLVLFSAVAVPLELSFGLLHGRGLRVRARPASQRAPLPLGLLRHASPDLPASRAQGGGHGQDAW
jgi:hypothetical protein